MILSQRFIGTCLGWTVFKNLYILSETIYIVTSHPETLPPRHFITSNGLDLVFRDENEPTNKTLSIISPGDAKYLFGTSAALLDGLSVSPQTAKLPRNSFKFCLAYANRFTSIYASYVSLSCWRVSFSQKVFLDH